MPRCRLHTRKQPALTEYTFTREDIISTWIWIIGVSAVFASLAVTRIQNATNWPAEVSVIAAMAAVCVCALAVASVITASESLIIHDSLGLVLQRRNLIGQNTSCSFIDKDFIEGLIINEVLSTTSVHCYLTFMLIGQDDMAVAFQALEPRVRQVVPVYRELLELGWGQKPAPPMPPMTG